MRALAALGTCAAMVFAASSGVAQERQARLVVIVAAPDDPFGLRVAAELEQLGFRTAMVEPLQQPSADALGAATRGRGAVGAIRAESVQSIEVLVTDPASGKTLRQQLPSARDAEGEGENESALALRSVELLRAGLVAVSLAAPEPRPVVDASRQQQEQPPDALAPEDPDPPRLHLGVAPGIAFAPGGLDPAVTLGVGASWLPSEHVGLVALALLPLTAAELERSQGVAELSPVLVGGGVRVGVLRRASRWSPGVDLGLAATWLRAHTTYDGSTTDTTSIRGTAFVRAGLGFAPLPQLRLRADVLAAWIGQGVSVRFHDRELATWGQPLVVPSLGAEIGLPL